MCRLLLVRHASCDHVGRRLVGRQAGITLNEAGRRQTDALAQRLAREPVTAVYSSPLERAMETAAPIADAHGLRPNPDDAFAELHYGDWTGRPVAELHADDTWRSFNALRSLTRIPGGELVLETQLRAVSALLHLRERHVDETIVVVSHGDVIRSALCYLLGMPIDHLLRLRIEPASVTEVAFGGAVPELVSLNVH